MTALAEICLPVALDPLKVMPRWCVWRWRTLPNGKRTKVPHQAAWPDIHARTNDPATWGAFDWAVEAVEAERADGIGFMLNDCEIAAFDLDDCREPETGEIAEWAMQLVDRSGSYAEITISGTGLRIVGTATGPYVHRKHRWPGTSGSVETYRRATRFIVVTGHELANGPGELAPIDDLIDETVSRLDAKPQDHQEPLFRPEPHSDPETDLPAELDRLVQSGVVEGDRSDQFMHVVGWLKDLGWPVEAIEALLARHPTGIAAKYAGRLRREIERCYGKARERASSSSSEHFHDPGAGEPADAADPLVGVTFDGAAPIEAPRMLVKDLLPRNGVGFIGGQSGAGKSFVAFDLAVSLATGEPFFGRRVRERVGTIILAAEGVGTVAPRIEALRHTKAAGEIMPIAWIGDVPNLSDPAEIQRIIPRLKAVAARIEERHGVRVGAVIIDTVAAAFGFKDENDNAEVQRAINAMARIGLALDALVIPIHHYGKDKGTGLRGASNFRGGAEAVLSVLGERNEVTGQVTDRALALAKSRVGQEGLISAFDIGFVKLGVDEDGDDFGAGYVIPKLDDPIIVTFKTERPRPEPRPIQALRAAFDEVIADGRTVRVMGDGPEVKAVTLNQIRPEFRRRYVTGEADETTANAAFRQAFKRALQACHQHGFATGNWSEEEWIWRL